jgi:hypothetical protein
MKTLILTTFLVAMTLSGCILGDDDPTPSDALVLQTTRQYIHADLTHFFNVTADSIAVYDLEITERGEYDAVHESWPYKFNFSWRTYFTDGHDTEFSRTDFQFYVYHYAGSWRADEYPQSECRVKENCVGMW